MNRQQKEQVIDALKHSFAQSSASFVIDYKGLTVSQMAALRKKLRGQGGSVKVAKITLIRKALNNTASAQALDDILHEQIALVFAQQEPPAVAKVISDFAREHEQFRVIGGCYEDALLSSHDVERFASLPSKEILLVQLCAVLQEPMNQLVRLCNAAPMAFVAALEALQEQKKSQS